MLCSTYGCGRTLKLFVQIILKNVSKISVLVSGSNSGRRNEEKVSDKHISEIAFVSVLKHTHFQPQIYKVFNEASQMLGFNKRQTRIIIDPKILLNLYYSCVWSALEYTSVMQRAKYK